MSSQHIDIFGLAAGLFFIALAAITSVIYGLKLEKDLAVGTLRTFVQLFIMGYVLSIVFDLHLEWLVFACFLFMTCFAAWIIRGRVKERQIPYLLPTLASMAIACFLVTAFVARFVIDIEPWWSPRYFITLGGMIVGNSTTAIAIALDRLFHDFRKNRDEVEMMLCLGADYKEASEQIVRNAMKAGMIPTINSMMGVGIVFIPGMMTGQILGGADPTLAIRYQIVVMLMLTGSTAAGSLMAALIARKLSFGSSQQLLLRPISEE